MDNALTIVGNLTDDPELRYTPNGVALVNARVAVNHKTRNEAGEWVDGDPLFISVTAWRSLAENTAESLTKGARVVVVGRLVQRSWESEDGKRSVIEITADEIAPSLQSASAQVERNRKRDA
ncbi:MAG: single-stranded DNA-binding protein [Actinomycetota bacterium]